MRDSCGRTIDYLRLSVTDLCNYRCQYCMPPEGVEKRLHSDILSIEELAEIAAAAVRCGVKKIRLTGGEPPVATASSPDLSILSRRHILSLADGALCLFQQVLCLLSAALRPAGGTKKTAPSGRRLRLISGGPASGCEAEPPPGVPLDTGEAVPQCPARHAGVEGRRGPLL